MEAIRSPPQSITNTRDEVDILPPPPAPFPVDFRSSENGEAAASTTGTAGEAIRSDVAQYLASVQQSCVHALSTLLPDDPPPSLSTTQPRTTPSLGPDTQLAAALSDLLEVTYELEGLVPSSPPPAHGEYAESPTTPRPHTAVSAGMAREQSSSSGMASSFDDLARDLQDLQSAREGGRGSAPAETGVRDERLHPAIYRVREELAWARLESLSQAVMVTARERGERGVDGSGGLPPSYEQHDLEEAHVHAHIHALPTYQDLHSDQPTLSGPSTSSKPSIEDHTSQKPPQRRDEVEEAPTASREKILHDLDAVTSAIERLYSVAPQLQNQRVEMPARARQAAAAAAVRPAPLSLAGKDEAKLSKEERIQLERIKMRELEEIWERIERAHGKRRIKVEDGQRAQGGEEWDNRSRARFINRVVDQAEASRLEGQDGVMGIVDVELARARDLRDRDHFLRDLIEQSADGRLMDQDANAPDGDLAAARQAKQHAFVSEIIARTRASRLSSQDFPLSAEDKLAEKRTALIENLVDFGTSGRLHDQDSLPPTPRGGEERKEDPFELISVQDFLASAPGSGKTGSNVGESEVGVKGEGMVRERSNSAPLGEDGVGKKGSKLQKIAGMVRRGSVHLGLKASSGLDANNVAYIVEHQENLHSVQVMLHGVGVSANAELALDTPSTPTCPDEAHLTLKRDSGLSTQIALPVPVLPNQSTTFLPQSLHLEAKLAAQPTPPAGATLAPSHALSASDLRGYAAKALCCTSCDRELAALPPASQEGGYKDLPSEHWAEMIEVWMCHDDPGFTARLAKQTKEGFWPRDGGVLVGGSYLLVEGKRGKMANVKVEAGGETEAWRAISCACGEVVGKKRAEDGKPGAGTLRFSKWAIGLLKEDEDSTESVESIRFPLSVFIVSDMLELAQAHASYRFIITEEESSEPRLYLWLFNASTRISYCKPSGASPLPSPLRASFTAAASGSNGGAAGDRRSVKSRRSSVASSVGAGRSTTGGVQGGSKVLRAAKIMYKAADDQFDISKLPGFGPGGQVETLSYPREVCASLVNVLRESTAVYPVTRRTMGAFDVGFLERV
ncbi:hypothetical protein IAT38_001155 [Cryptococcus sp. DSM 104549]